MCPPGNPSPGLITWAPGACRFAPPAPRDWQGARTESTRRQRPICPSTAPQVSGSARYPEQTESQSHRRSRASSDVAKPHHPDHERECPILEKACEEDSPWMRAQCPSKSKPDNRVEHPVLQQESRAYSQRHSSTRFASPSQAGQFLILGTNFEDLPLGR